MKTLLCSVLSLFLLVSQAHAENRWGVLAGADFAHVRVSTPAGSVSGDTHTGFMGGIFTQYGLSDGLYFEPQLRFNQRGGGDNSLNYLQLPLYLKYKFVEAGAFVPVVFVGPNVGYRVGSSLDDAQDDLYKNFDLSADLGVGGEFAVAEGMNLGVSVAYSLGLLNIVEGAPSGSSVKNRGVEAYASLSWAL
jgi:hypothetical protein